LLRPQLCHEALRMGRVLTSIAPHEPEAHGLLALMELNASRTAARTDQAGEPILLLEQNRALWDQLQIRRGMQALGRAHELGGANGFYALQAAIIACHAQASRAEDTDWSRISGLYGQLAALVRSPVIELNRAVAVGMADGPEAGLAIVDRLVQEPALKTYHLLGSVRGDLPAQARPLRGSPRRTGSSCETCRQPARTGFAEAARCGGGACGDVVVTRLRAERLVNAGGESSGMAASDFQSRLGECSP